MIRFTLKKLSPALDVERGISGASLEATDGGRMEAVGMVGKEQRGQS